MITKTEIHKGKEIKKQLQIYLETGEYSWYGTAK